MVGDVSVFRQRWEMLMLDLQEGGRGFTMGVTEVDVESGAPLSSQEKVLVEERG